ncbi:MAG: polysaccharide biosynthesis protein [Vallitaleaceae bacterium]|nr:polysaccharide biosynthesis protein [Vallitaleaceae bacterium]
MDVIKKKSRTNSLVVQGGVLAIAFIFVRLIGFFYRIPLANLLTDEGSGYYNNSFVIYTFFLMVSTYGFPNAISKLTAEKHAQKKYKEAQVIFKSALSLALLLGVVFSIILWFGAKELAILSGTPKSFYSIRALAPALFCFSLLSVFRGYFQGMNTMVPTAISQVIEQIFNAVFSLILAAILVKKGVEYGASGSTIGTGIGALSAFLFLAFVYKAASHTIIRKNLKLDQQKFSKKSIFHYWKIILWLAFPMVLGTIIMNLTNVIDMFMFQRALLFKGLTSAKAAELYGFYTMKNQILINLPVAVAAALSTASIPGLSASVINNEVKAIEHKINTALRATLLTMIPAAVGLFVLAYPILTMLFKGDHLDLAAKLLQLSTLSAVFFGISTVCIGLIQGLGKLKQQVYISLIALVVKVLFNFVFFYLFDLRLYGAIFSNTIYAIFSAYLSIRVIKQVVKIKIDFKRTIAIPALASVFMGIVCYVMYYVVGGISGSNTLATLMAIFMSFLAFGFLMIKLGGISENEILAFPKGAGLVAILRKFGLL